MPGKPSPVDEKDVVPLAEEEDDDVEVEDEDVAPTAPAAPAAPAVPAKAAAAEEPEEGEGEEGPVRYRMPDPTKREMFGIADQLLGASKMIVMCEDGKSRMARIPGKMKRRMWIKPGDLVIVKPWDFQDDKADVTYRYLRTQSTNLSRRGLLPELLDGNF